MAGDEEAFSRLVAEHHAPLVRLARSFVADDATAEEVVQDAWMGVFAGLPRFEGRSSLKTWIFRIVTNIAKTRGVRDQRRSQEEPGSRDELSPERHLLGREAFDVVAEALWALPANQQRVVVLRDVEGVDVPDVCRILGVSENNLRVLHHRARAKLRKTMENYAA